MAAAITQGVSLDTFLQLSSAVVATNPCTLAFNFNTTDNGQPFVLSVGNGDSREGWYLGLYAGQVRALQASGIFSGAAYSGSGLNDGAWHHAAGVFENNGSRYAYSDGGNASQDTFSLGSPSVDRTTIGSAIAHDGITYFAAYTECLANCAIWNAALTAGEIEELSKGKPPTKVRPQSLVFFPKFENNATKLVNIKGAPLTANTGSGSFSDCTESPNAPRIIKPTAPEIYFGTYQVTEQVYGRVYGLR